MIRIISGVYSAKLIRPNDPPFSLSPENEKRLVDRGVAEYVIENGIQLGDNSAMPVYDINMTDRQLRGLCDAYKLDHKKAKKKAELIELLDNYVASLDEDDIESEELEADEDAPVLNADLPTV